MADSTIYTIWTDGGARGNPGPAAIGARILQAKTVLAELSLYLGKRTNNQAEYQALIEALEWLIAYLNQKHQLTINCQIQIFTDSELMAYQIQGRYRVKNGNLQPLWRRVMSLLNQFGGYTITPVRREKNQVADRLVNQAIDQALKQVKLP